MASFLLSYPSKRKDEATLAAFILGDLAGRTAPTTFLEEVQVKSTFLVAMFGLVTMVMWIGCGGQDTGKEPGETSPAGTGALSNQGVNLPDDVDTPLSPAASASNAPAGVVPPAQSSPANVQPSAANSGGAADCRDDYKEFPWKRETKNECTKCWDCPGEGFLPGMAFVACKIDNKCYRFATVNNCDYDLCPKGNCVLPTHSDSVYCRKDGINYTYFICRVNGVKYTFQTVNAVNYYDKAERLLDMVGNVADVLPIVGGCSDHSGAY